MRASACPLLATAPLAPGGCDTVVSRERESVVDQRYEANRKGYFAQTVW